MTNGNPIISVSDVPDGVLSLIEELREVRGQIKALKSREDKIRKSLLSHFVGVNEVIAASGNPILMIDRSDRSWLNSDRVQALYPDVWLECQRSALVQTVNLPSSD